MKKTTLIVNMEKEKAYSCVINTIKKYVSLGITVMMDNSFKDKFACHKGIIFFDDFYKMLEASDFITVIGGDGTLIHAAKHAAQADKPLIGINLGKLGFVTEVEPDNLDVLGKIAKGEYSIKKRMLLEVKVLDFEKTFCAFNDVALTRAYPSNMISVKAICDFKYTNP